MNFDENVATYSAQLKEALRCECGHEFFQKAKVDELVRLAAGLGSASGLKVLDVGCGIGLLASHLAGVFGKTVGVDIAGAAAREAHRNVPGAAFLEYDGSRLPFADASFDIAVAVCMFHHVHPSNWTALASEIARVVRPGGLTAIFEHNPWNLVTRWVVHRCEFDADAVLLSMPTSRRVLASAGLSPIAHRFLFFFPWPGTFWRRIERFLAWLPLGAQHVTWGLRRG